MTSVGDTIRLFWAGAEGAGVAAGVPAVDGRAGICGVPVHPAIPVAAQRRRIARNVMFFCIREITGRQYLIIVLLRNGKEWIGSCRNDENWRYEGSPMQCPPRGTTGQICFFICSGLIHSGGALSALSLIANNGERLPSKRSPLFHAILLGNHLRKR